MAETVFAEGLYYNPPNEKAPDFIVGNLSLQADRFAAWLAQQQPNNKGYVNLVIKRAKSGKVYVALDTWEPTKPSQAFGDVPSTVPDKDDCPF